MRNGFLDLHFIFCLLSWQYHWCYSLWMVIRQVSSRFYERIKIWAWNFGFRANFGVFFHTFLIISLRVTSKVRFLG